jgi:hypothetical protein
MKKNNYGVALAFLIGTSSHFTLANESSYRFITQLPELVKNIANDHKKSIVVLSFFAWVALGLYLASRGMFSKNTQEGDNSTQQNAPIMEPVKVAIHELHIPQEAVNMSQIKAFFAQQNLEDLSKKRTLIFNKDHHTAVIQAVIKTALIDTLCKKIAIHCWYEDDTKKKRSLQAAHNIFESLKTNVNEQTQPYYYQALNRSLGSSSIDQSI